MPTIIVGDFNGHHTIWKSSTTVNRGKIISDIINHRDPSTLLSISWEVLPFLYGTDHYTIKICNNCTPLIPKHPTPMKWRLNKADCNKFSDKISQNVTTYPLTGDINIVVENFTEVIANAAEYTIDRTSTITKHNPVPWWSPSCGNAIRASCTLSTKRYRHQESTLHKQPKRQRNKIFLALVSHRNYWKWNSRYLCTQSYLRKG